MKVLCIYNILTLYFIKYRDCLWIFCLEKQKLSVDVLIFLLISQLLGAIYMIESFITAPFRPNQKQEEFNAKYVSRTYH